MKGPKIKTLAGFLKAEVMRKKRDLRTQFLDVDLPPVPTRVDPLHRAVKLSRRTILVPGQERPDYASATSNDCRQAVDRLESREALPHPAQMKQGQAS